MIQLRQFWLARSSYYLRLPSHQTHHHRQFVMLCYGYTVLFLQYSQSNVVRQTCGMRVIDE